MRLTLPLPPSANDYWKRWRGRVVVSTEARAYKQGVRLRALTAGLRPLQGEVVLSVAIFRARRVGDTSNFIKILEDALQGVAYENDSQVVELHARRYEDKANPRVEVRVEPDGAKP